MKIRRKQRRIIECFIFMIFVTMNNILKSQDSTISPTSLGQSDKILVNSQRSVPWDLFIGAIGFESLTGNTKETLKTGIAIQLCEFEYIPPHTKWFKLGITLIDMGFHTFNTTPTEQRALREKYEKVTYLNGIENKRESIDDIKCATWRISISPKFYPINGSTNPVRPFFGVGLSFHRVESLIKVSKGIDSDPANGFNLFLRFGTDIYTKNHSFFYRLEVIKGWVPNWEARILPELREIRDGGYWGIRFGIGMPFPSKGRI